MNREQLCQLLGWLQMPKESEMLGRGQHSVLLDRIETIVQQAVLAEREACAEICDRIAMRYGEDPEMGLYQHGFGDGAEVCRNRIRARGQE